MLDRLYELEQVAGFSSALIGAIGKFRGYYARLALVLHVAEEQSALIKTPPTQFASFINAQPTQFAGVISKETAERCEQLVFDFLLPHTFGLYDVVANGGQDRDTVRAIGDFILASDKDRLRPSDLTAGVRRLRNQPANKIAEWASRFCALGWLQPEDERAPRAESLVGRPGPADVLRYASAACSGGPRRRPRNPQGWGNTAMIGSDKSAVNGVRFTHHVRGRLAADILNEKNLSIPRARKEKCQTRRSWCRTGGRWPRSTALLDGFHRLFTPFLCPNSNGRSAWRLTFLTPACQKCQTRLPFLASRCDESSGHHDNIGSRHHRLRSTSIALGLHRVAWRSEATETHSGGYSSNLERRSHHAVFRTISKVRP